MAAATRTRMLCILALTALAWTSAVGGQVPSQRIKAMTVELPLTPESVCSVGAMWEGVSKSLVGVECFWKAEPREGATRAKVVHQLDLSGLDIPSAFERLAAQLPGYDFTVAPDITLIRPNKDPRNPSMLDAVFPRFSVHDVSLVEAADAVSRLFDASFVPLEICSAASSWSFTTGIPTGVECRFDTGPPPAALDDRITSFLDVSSLDVEEGLNLIAGRTTPPYSVRFVDRSFAVLRPALAERGR